MTEAKKTERVELSSTRRPRPRGAGGGVTVKTAIKAGPTRRAELDHVGAYNFMVEISGVNAGY
ncbi:MAG: hypothetical protein H6719_35770 [Sandaracinaceae bacterium]|nr:hypothetical protein [Sandaracinaceae bacterium]